jgi:hypothetical protein
MDGRDAGIIDGSKFLRGDFILDLCGTGKKERHNFTDDPILVASEVGIPNELFEG